MGEVARGKESIYQNYNTSFAGKFVFYIITSHEYNVHTRDESPSNLIGYDLEYILPVGCRLMSLLNLVFFR